MTDIERPWLASYPPGVPARINLDEYRSIAHVLEIACERFSHRPAFENMGKVLTYADVDRLSRQFAAYLLNYAHTAEELGRMCRAVAAALRPCGRFVTANNNPA